MRGEAAPAFVYVPDLPDAGSGGWIDGEERHHLLNVCRAAPGERATATDGRGRRATIRIEAVGRRVAFRVETVETIAPDPAAVVACGAPEGTRGDWLVEKLAELGVGEFQPLDTARARWRWPAGRAARCERLTVAALKQSRRAHRLRLAAPLSVAEWLGARQVGGAAWLADAEGRPAGSLPAPGRFTAVAGPAPGFTAGERESLLAAGFVPVRLGGGTLRAETAALALAALWAAGTGEGHPPG